MPDAFLDATAQAELVRTGQVSPVELVDEAVNRIEKLNGELNAVIHPLFDQAREQARGELPNGPFRGVPLVLKDLLAAIKGDPIHEGMKFLRDANWKHDQTDALAQKYLDAGFVVVGRTNTPELGLVPTTEPLVYGPTRNPWDTTKTTGGSSGGSAAAVASGMVAVGHANDGGGSIRIPASCCGLVGLKPSRGRTSMMPDYSALDDLLIAELCVTRSVRDTAGVLDALQGPVVGDTVAAPPPARPYVQEVGPEPGRLRIGVLLHNPLESGDIHPDCIAAARDAAQLLESLGHHVEEAFPAQLSDATLVNHFTSLWATTLVYNFMYWERKVGRPITADDVEPLTWTLAELGRSISAPDYVAAQHVALALGRDVEAWFASGYDLLLTPTLGEPPVDLGTFQTPDEPLAGFIRAAGFVPYTPIANMTGEPAISLPLSWNGAGLPIGVQLQAAYGREDVLLRVAGQLEARGHGPIGDRPSMPDVKIAGGQGFYGDTPTAVDALLAEGIDYLCLEALAELTLAILQKDRARDETRGYTRDLPAYLARALPFVADGRTKVITNAGGINPTAAAHAAVETARQLGVTGITIATVVGDDVLGRLPALHTDGQSFTHLDTGEQFADFPGDPLFASAYLGARPIVDALAQGADIVITGRVADASLFLAPLAYEHEWAADDWDRQAAGILVGHLLECSGQSVGGNYSGDWWALPHPWDLPYPMATVAADGTAVISKPAGSGGRVSTDTLRHQLLYEVHDPARYLAPDVVADFTSARFEDLPDDRVRITGVRGTPATDTYKLLLASHAGWAGEARIAFSWPDAYEKAKATAAILMKRVEMAGHPVDEWCVEYWGVDALGGDTVPAEPACEPPECVLRIAWRCADQRTAGLVGRELVPLTLSAPPAGMTGAGRGAGSATELLSIWPTLVDKAVVDPEVRVVLEEVT